VVFFFMQRYTMILVLIAAALASEARNAVWESEFSLSTDISVKSPDKARGMHNLALAAIARQDFQYALALLLKSLEHHPYRGETYVNLGIAYAGLKEWDTARQMFEKSIVFDSGNAVAYLNLGILLYQSYHDFERARELLQRSRDLDPLNPDVHYHLGAVYRELGKDDLSREEFARQKMLQ
jgi:tetratricopeptide (TPR) repeat protein